MIVRGVYLLMKENNHYYPHFHIKNWLTKSGYMLYDKGINQARTYKKREDFAEKFYYSLGKEDCALEDKISEYEQYISKIIKKIIESKCKIELSLKEIELLKLYCVFTTSRQHFTTEVIKSDPSEIYKSNDYIIGTHRLSNPNEVVKICEEIYKNFEIIKNMDENEVIKALDNNPFNSLSEFTYGLHLNIFKSNKNSFCISNICAIIENTMDSNHLFVYFPISPNRALILIKTKYYKDIFTYYKTLKLMEKIYFATSPDKWISSIFGEDTSSEKLLLPTYKFENNSWSIKIQALPHNIIEKFNSIFYEDGKLFLYVNAKDLKHAQNHQLAGREIEIKPIL